MLLALLLAQLAPANPAGPIVTNPATMRRLAFFEAFPANGAGTNGACSTTPPTDVRGGALIFARASVGTCTKGTDGLRSSAIADGDLVSLSNDVPRVELDSAGVPSLLAEGSDSQVAVQTANVCNAAWSDVGTPSCTANAATGPWGTTTMARLTDDAAGAFEGRSQAIVTTSATKFTTFCYVKAGTLAAASITLVGAGSSTGDCTGTVTGLSTSTSSIVECTSSAAYAGTLTGVTVTIRAGTVVGDTGTVFVESCDVKPASRGYRTSHMPAVASGTTRASEVGARFALSGVSTTFSMAATAQTSYAQTTTGPQWLSLETSYGEASPKALGYSNAGFANTFINGGGLFSTGVGWIAGRHRFSMDSSRAARFDATTTTTTAALLSAPPTVVVLGGNGAAGLPCDCLINQVQVDPSEARAR
jgi:hypothetical protein